MQTHMYICTCALAVYWRSYPHARDGNGCIVGARHRTHGCMRGGLVTCMPIPISHTSTHTPVYIYMCIMHTCIYMRVYVCIYITTHGHVYTYMHISRTRSYTYTRVRPRMRVPTHLGTHTRARASAAHNGPRRIDDPPSASRLRWRAARAEETAHTPFKSVTRAVFHSPMFALNADAKLNACVPSHPRSTAGRRRLHVWARMRARPIEHAHTRAKGRSSWGAWVRRARIGDPFVGVARHACI